MRASLDSFAIRYLVFVQKGWCPDRILQLDLHLAPRKWRDEEERIYFLHPDQIEILPVPDRTILKRIRQWYHPFHKHEDFRPRYDLREHEWKTFLPELCASGHCALALGYDAPRPLAWSGGPPWEAILKLTGAHGATEVAGFFRRANTPDIPFAAPACVFAGGLLFHEETVAPLDCELPFEWLSALATRLPLRLAERELKPFLAEVAALPKPPHIERDAGPGLLLETPPPEPRLDILPPCAGDPRQPALFRGRLHARYGAVEIACDEARGMIESESSGQLLRRDRQAEAKFEKQLEAAGFLEPPFLHYQDSEHPLPEIAQPSLPAAVKTLAARGWAVTCEGRPFWELTGLSLCQETDAEGFSLKGTCGFGNVSVPLAQLMKKWKRGENCVILRDGRRGWLAPAWLERLEILEGLSQGPKGTLRFAPSQRALLDALLASWPEAERDGSFRAWEREREAFQGIAPLAEEAGFQGTLRDYQRFGLGWLAFLDRQGWGGCLADEMGLGKTVQVLAWLQRRRAAAAEGPRLPSLIVAPKSVTYNWLEECARFTPGLKVLEHAGQGRERPGPHFAAFDLVVVSYGLLRRDEEAFREVPFDYAILDEAQAIKNADTDLARAARALTARRRLALTGTPIENRASDLWSIFEFLNPGMLGRSRLFRELCGEDGDPAKSALPAIRRALQPFLLRRTKANVAPELPAKTEQTLYCELEAEQAAFYEWLRADYRKALLAQIAEEGLEKAKFSVLTMLLRLRQAACHPGLIDPARADVACPKFEVLLERLGEIRAEGGKALVFSQFTSLLALLKPWMERAGLPFEYLDGSARDRADRVARFQSDPHCPFFLISLKAGGAGLNLTAASYVFLLDPWWNPAVEAQAIDRVHRIGQSEHVNAYRLIARGTVEERVATLQAEKQALAEALVTENASLLQKLSREDLELLFS